MTYGGEGGREEGGERWRERHRGGEREREREAKKIFLRGHKHFKKLNAEKVNWEVPSSTIYY